MDDPQHLFLRKEPRPLLGEPSLADAMVAISTDINVPDTTRRHWLTSMRGIATAIGRPPKSIPCRMTSLRHHVGRLNAPALGWEQKTLANHKSNVKAAINHFMKVKNIPTRGAPLSSHWKSLFEAIQELKPRRLLSSFARYCSVHNIPPPAVTEELVIQYFGFREMTGFLRSGVSLPRELMKAWNSCVEKVPGWPQQLLCLPGLPNATKGPDWDEFPESLRFEIETYLAHIAKPHRSANDRRRRSNKPSTILTRRRELIAFARTAVAAGVSIKSLMSLKALLHSDVVKLALETYLDRNGETAKGYTIDLAWKLRSIAKTIGAPPETINFLDEVWARLEHDRGPVLTPKNQDVIRSVLMTDVWGKVCALPQQMMGVAKRMLNSGPKKALAIATTALQIQILTRAPIRIGNLLAIRLGINLTRDRESGSYRLHFPDYDTKNRVDLDFTLTGQTAALIEEFITVFRPFLGEGHKGDWLFPGEDEKQRSPSHASAAIAASMTRHVGLRLTAHQFRHAAVAVIMKSRPGDYEFAARLLGHRNVETTKRYYSSLESFNANGIFGAMIEEQMWKSLKPKPSRAKSRKKNDLTPRPHSNVKS
ncbi:MAG: site-specific integrase [Aestuariivirga sp.]